MVSPAWPCFNLLLVREWALNRSAWPADFETSMAKLAPDDDRRHGQEFAVFQAVGSRRYFRSGKKPSFPAPKRPTGLADLAAAGLNVKDYDRRH
jgi:hypothetical protein